MAFIRNNYLLIAITVLVSFALTFYAIIVDPIINPDALLYLSAADEFKQGNFSNGIALYKWPFYSILISFLSSTFGLSLQSAAHVFNGTMHAMGIVGFLACVHALGGNKKTLVIAAILLLIFPSLNKYRSLIIRDAGFLAFYFWSLYHLLLAIQTDQIKRYCYAFILMLIAMLFRIEAIAMLAIVPTYILYSKSTHKFYRFCWSGITIVIASVLFFGISVWLFGEQSKSLESGILGMLQASVQHLNESLDFKLTIIRKQLLNEFSFKIAPFVLIVSVIGLTIYETLRRLAYVYAFLSWHALKNRLVLQQTELRHLFYVLCLIQLILLFLFALINMFLISRHTMALTLTILLLAPFSLEFFFEKWQNRKTHSLGILKYTLPILLTIIGILGIDGLDLKTNKIELIEAGEWVSQNTNLL